MRGSPGHKCTRPRQTSALRSWRNGTYAATESLCRRRARTHAATLLPMKGSMDGNSPFNSFQGVVEENVYKFYPNSVTPKFMILRIEHTQCAREGRSGRRRIVLQTLSTPTFASYITSKNPNLLSTCYLATRVCSSQQSPSTLVEVLPRGPPLHRFQSSA